MLYFENDKKYVNFCNQCGSCCNCIWLPISHKDYKENINLKKQFGDYEFIINNLTPLKFSKANNLNKFFCNGKEKDDDFYKHLYICSKLKNNKCSDYKNRPLFCSEYPIYKKIFPKKDFHNEKFYSEKCGWKKIVYIQDICSIINGLKNIKSKEGCIKCL
jgi:Fe-S-cluster containining protein